MSKHHRNIAILSVSLLLFIALSTLASQRILPADKQLALFFDSLMSPGLTALARTLDIIGNAYALATISTGLIAFALWRKKFRTALMFSVGFYGGLALVFFLKLFFARPRPELADQIVEVVNYSYPSGHATGATLFSLLFVFWLKNMYNLSDRATFWIQCVMLLFLLLVGTSRVYLGAHFASDVVGGWLLGTTWVFLILTLHTLSQRQNN